MIGRDGYMIPKKIHYCWFGKGKKSKLALKCIRSWRQYCPEYEVIEWNEENFDIDMNGYTRMCYAEKKYAYLSDYVRLWVVEKYGGIYFDTDVEVIKSMDDIIQKGAFIGRERIANAFPVNAGLGLAAEPKMPIIKEIVEHYEQAHFEQVEKMETVVEKVTNILRKYGLSNEQKYEIIEGMQIYPSDYFCPYDYNVGELNITDNSRSIHWYDASWFDNKMKKRRDVCVKIQKTLRGRLGECIAKLYTSLSYYWEWTSTGDYETIKKKIKNRIKGKGKK